MKKLTYCLHCKKDTANKKETVVITNGRRMMKSICSVCGKKKSTFLPKQSGKGPVDFVLNNLPIPEQHLTDKTSGKAKKYNFCGPFTKLNARLKRGDAGINELDEACKAHDISYNTNRKATDRHIHDLQLARIAEKLANDTKTNPDIVKNANLVSAVMRGKVRLGLGKTKNML